VIICSTPIQNSPGKDLPRLWWCLTGPLAFLPLHAAGIYPVDENEKVLCLADFAMSSYTPTLTALAESQRPSQNTMKPTRLLAVIQPDIPVKNSLPGTKKELAIIKHYTADHMLTTLAGSEATLEKVVPAMGQCSWVHLACHGIQDLVTPTKSGFEVDPEGDRLELSKIISMSLPHADFAFLSACQTATGDLKHPDEAIHLAAGMLSAGYHSVIATMWSIDDSDAPVIADAVYSHLLADKEPNSQKAAKALHLAVQTLRKSYNSASFVSWVPFIHMGA
jgi:CHAT domain-containing protein